MAVEILFPLLAVALFALAVWGTAAGLPGFASRGEGRAHLALLAPLLPGLLVLAFLAGWAIQESEPADERTPLALCLLAAAGGVVALRALMRAISSLRRAARAPAPVATVGLLRCRTVASDEFRRAASPEVLEAALAHEAAHARSRDPLRIWLAQLAADLQWPLPGARRRLRDWLQALELRRDAQAVAAGVSPTALAEGIILAARLGRRAVAGAAITGDGSDGAIALRVRSLLSGRAHGEEEPRARRLAWVSFAAMLTTMVWLGAAYGEAVVSWLPGLKG